MRKGKFGFGISAVVATVLLAGCEKELILTGERFPIRAELAASVPTDENPDPKAGPERPENQSVAISLPAAQNLASWSHRGGNAQHSSPHGVLSALPARVWSASIGSGSSKRNRLSAAPVVADGRVFAMDSRAKLTAVSTSGGVLWSTDLTAKFDRGGDVSGGGIAVDGANVYAATGYGELIAVDASSGAVRWRQRLESPVAGAPAVDAGVVYVSTRDGAGYAVDAKNGKVIWTLTGTSGELAMVGSAAPAIDQTLVLFPFASGELAAAVKQSGERAWAAPVTGQRLGRGYQGVTDITGDPVLVGGRIYAGTAAGRLAAIDASSGQRLWTATEGAMSAPLVVGGSVFVVNDEARLVRLDAETGQVIWSADMPYFLKDKPKKQKSIHGHYGPVLAGGHIVVVSSDGLVRLFNPGDGAMVGTVDIPGGAAAPPALSGGTLYVIGGNGQLHAFR